MSPTKAMLSAVGQISRRVSRSSGTRSGVMPGRRPVISPSSATFGTEICAMITIAVTTTIAMRGDGTAFVGITDYAQKQLGDVVFVELPDVGRSFAQGEVFGTIESVKAVSELFAPVSGEIVDVNAALRDQPELVNTDPHGAWMVAIRVANTDEIGGLLDSAQYAELAG